MVSGRVSVTIFFVFFVHCLCYLVEDYSIGVVCLLLDRNCSIVDIDSFID